MMLPLLLATAVPDVVVGPDSRERAPQVEAPIEVVTVFSDRARVERRVTLSVKAGVNPVRLPDLPGATLLDTVRVSTKGARVIRAEAIPVLREVVSIAQVEGELDQLDKVSDEIARLNAKITVEAAHLDWLTRVTPAAPVEEKDRDGRPALPVATSAWFRAIGVLTSRDASTRKNISNLTVERTELEEKRGRIQQSLARKNLGGFTNRQVEVLAVLETQGAKKVQLTLTYDVPGAHWKPAYDLQYDTKGQLKVATSARVVQATGEDWSDVKLRLSTAIPGQGIDLPELLTWTLSESREVIPRARPAKARPPVQRYPAPAAQSTQLEADRALAMAQILQRFSSVTGRSNVAYQQKTVIDFDGAGVGGTLTKPDGAYLERRKRTRSPSPRPPAPSRSQSYSDDAPMSVVSESSGSSSGRSAPSYQYKSLPLFDPPPPVQTFSDRDLPAVTAGGFDYVFEAPARSTVKSTGAQKTVPLSTQTFPANVVYEATPSIDTTAYVKARVKNAGTRPILRGSSTIFVNGEFVAQGVIETTGPGGEIGFPLGADENIRLVRNVLPKTVTEGVFSKDDVTTYVTEIQVGNYKRQDVTVEIIDQVPKTRHEDVEVEFLSATPAPVKKSDADGVLRWRISVRAGKTSKIRFSYKITRPKDWQLRQQ